MSRNILFLVLGLVLCIPYSSRAQKPVLTPDNIVNWAELEYPLITADGKYACFYIKNFEEGVGNLVVTSTDGRWRKEMLGALSYQYSFLNYDGSLIFFKPKDSLCIVKLGSDSVEVIANVGSYKTPKSSASPWLAYLKKKEKRLTIENRFSGQKMHFAQVANYYFNDEGTAMLFLVYDSSVLKDNLNWLDLRTGIVKTIWAGSGFKKIVYNGDGQGLAIIDTKGIWYYRVGMEYAQNLNDKQGNFDSTLVLDNVLGFDKSGGIIFASYKEKPQTKKFETFLNLWSYSDPKLQSAQISELSTPHSFIGAVATTGGFTRIENENEKIWIQYFDHSKGRYIPITARPFGGGYSEDYWNAACKQERYLFDVQTGKKKELKIPEWTDSGIDISPNDNFVIFFDPKQQGYVSYSINEDKYRFITARLKVDWGPYNRRDLPVSPLPVRGIAGWLRGDSGVLIYDRYDLWQIDPLGKYAPINLTNSKGRETGTVYFLANNKVGVFQPGATILLGAFNDETKKNGFSFIQIGSKKSIDQRVFDDFMYHIEGNAYLDGSSFPPLKAVAAEAYIVRRMNGTESPNYYFTKDFKTFIELSHIYPERKYNWMTVEMFQFKTSEGKLLKALLYKPENFDPNKKYPVIFNYYEKLSDRLHMYLKPDISGGVLNIPLMVSNGYIVCTPDISYKKREDGTSALYAITAAANDLAKKRWVDDKRMGLQGFSFGAIQTNYLVTHSGRFAAACSASGFSDFISGYGSLEGGDGTSLQRFYEAGQLRIGATPWQERHTYLSYSPIFSADKVTTPLLMMHTKNDVLCLFSNALEFFTALRRMGKKVWLLEYEDGNHGIYGKSAKDYTIRMMQFFDFYLKNAPAPQWMIHGLPAKTKGMNTGLELEAKAVQPGPGLLTIKRRR